MVVGVRSMRMLSALAALGMAAGGPDVLMPTRGIPADPERERRRDEDRRRREKRMHEERAWERRQRRRAQDEMHERLLRERIAKGQDDRADKYLHSAARRRRREAERNAPILELGERVSAGERV